MFMYGGYRFLYDLSEEHLVYSSYLLNNNQNILVYPVNCCTKYANIETQYTLVFLVYFGSSTISIHLTL